MSVSPRRIYISTISAAWPVPKQEALLDAEAPGWRDFPVAIDDQVSARARRERNASVLTEREKILRKNTRAVPIEVTVAALPVLAWDGPDMLGVLAAMADANLALVALHDRLEIQPDSTDAERKRMVTEFLSRKKAASEEASRLKGAAVSAARRREAGKAGADRIRDRWPLPSAEWPTAVLLKEAGITRNTANFYLEATREQAQAKHQAMLKRAGKRKGKSDE